MLSRWTGWLATRSDASAPIRAARPIRRSKGHRDGPSIQWSLRQRECRKENAAKRIPPPKRRANGDRKKAAGGTLEGSSRRSVMVKRRANGDRKKAAGGTLEGSSRRSVMATLQRRCPLGFRTPRAVVRDRWSGSESARQSGPGTGACPASAPPAVAVPDR
jgi:hypothetical protein